MSDDKKRISEILEKWVPYFMIAFITIGAFIGSAVINYLQGDVPYEVIVGFVVASVMLTIIQMVKQKLKKDRLPEVDERVAKNVSKFFAYSSHITLGLVVVGLAVVTALGDEAISIYYLWVLFILYLWVVSIGTFILKRR